MSSSRRPRVFGPKMLIDSDHHVACGDRRQNADDARSRRQKAIRNPENAAPARLNEYAKPLAAQRMWVGRDALADRRGGNVLHFCRLRNALASHTATKSLSDVRSNLRAMRGWSWHLRRSVLRRSRRLNPVRKPHCKNDSASLDALRDSPL